MLTQFTIKQMIIAAGLSRKLTRIEICRVANCVTSYVTKSLRNPQFNNLIKKFDNLPEDNDTKEYRGAKTLYMEVGRLIYLEGEK